MSVLRTHCKVIIKAVYRIWSWIKTRNCGSILPKILNSWYSSSSQLLMYIFHILLSSWCMVCSVQICTVGLNCFLLALAACDKRWSHSLYFLVLDGLLLVLGTGVAVQGSDNDMEHDWRISLSFSCDRDLAGKRCLIGLSAQSIRFSSEKLNERLGNRIAMKVAGIYTNLVLIDHAYIQHAGWTGSASTA